MIGQCIWYVMALWEFLCRGWLRAGDYWAVQVARHTSRATAFVLQPEPRFYGVAARGLQILAHGHSVNGELTSIPPQDFWTPPNADKWYIRSIHGFSWMGDVATVDTAESRKQAKAWVFDWISRFGGGTGPGWSADVTARRIMNWTSLSVLILHQAESEQSSAYFRSLSHQIKFLSNRWQFMRPGLSRFEALSAMIHCGLALEGHKHVAITALRDLGRECSVAIEKDGWIKSRNPEELLEIFTLVSGVKNLLGAQGREPGPEILLALQHLAPTIRSLRLGDGTITRFHGGASGLAERVDQALADAAVPTPARATAVMGYSRLVAGSSVLIMDTGRLPGSKHALTSHASTLAFEMSSSTIPILVGMGSAKELSATLKDVCRTTAAHNGVVVGDVSLAGFAGSGFVERTLGRRLVDGPAVVTATRSSNEHGHTILASHDGYSATHGLIHSRQIAVVYSGYEVQGCDNFTSTTFGEKVRFSRIADLTDGDYRIPFAAHFRIHPDVVASLDMGGEAVSLKLGNSDVWLFRSAGAKMTLQDAIYIEQGKINPRATKEIVVTGEVLNYVYTLNWTLSRSE